MKRLHRGAAVGALALAGLLAVLPATAAQADTLTLDSESQLTAPYGQSWHARLDGTLDEYAWGSFEASATVHGAPAGYTPQASFYLTNGSGSSGFGYVYPGQGRPLPAGKYTIDFFATTPSGDASISSTSPLNLTITAAELGIEARAVAEATTPGAVAVTARFTGDFAQNFFSTSDEWAPLTPAGTWTITLTDSSGDKLERTIERSETDDVLATSFMWMDATPGEEYTVDARFEATGASAKNFAISAASPFSFTAPATERSFTASDADEPTALHPVAEVAFSVPVWWTVLAGLVLAALAAIAIMLAVRLRRLGAASLPVTTLEEGEAHV